MNQEDYKIAYENVMTANKMLEQEIERLNKRNKEIYEGFMATTKELTEYAEEVERLNNIIKEVREYIEENEYSFIDKHGNSQDITQFLEILDKENKYESNRFIK